MLGMGDIDRFDVDTLLKLAVAAPRSRREMVLSTLCSLLIRKGYGGAGPFRFGAEVDVDDRGKPVCENCRKPIETPRDGVLLEGWVKAIGDGGESVGGLVGSDNHMGPWAYCHACFARGVTFCQREGFSLHEHR